MQTTTANDYDCEDAQPQAASVRFLLTEAEFNEANVTRKSWMSNRFWRYAARTICAFGACFFIAAPSLSGEPWPVLIRTEPLTAIGWFFFALLNVYVALGLPGIHILNRHFNRFDLEREITLTEDSVRITRGPKSWKKKWSEFVCFYESSAMYVLKCRGAVFWTVPKRAFEPGVEPVFRNILERRLRRR